MDSEGGQRATVIRAVVYVAVLYGSFAHNIFWVPDGVFSIRDGFRTGYVGYDSDLVVNRLALARDGVHPLHPLYWQDYQNSRTGFVYTSQFGLQGVVLGAVYRIVGGDVEVFACRAACVFTGLTACVLAAFFGSVARRVGPTAGDVGVLLTAGSPVLLPFATSLYWVPFLTLAPFLAVWLLYPRCERSRVGFVALLGLVVALVCLKSLCGYEYITTVILAPVAALVYHRAAAGDRLRTCLRPAASIVAAGLVGFALALALHAAQLEWVVGKDPLATIGGRASGMTVRGPVDTAALNYACLAPDAGFLPDRIRFPLRLLVNYFWLPATATPVTWGPAGGFASFGLVVLGFLAVAWAIRRRELPGAIAALVPAGGVGFLAGLSWHILAHNHTYIHTHLNLICYFVPFALIAYSVAGWVIERFAVQWGVIRMVPWLLAIGAVAGNLMINTDPNADRQAVATVEAALQDGHTPAVYPTQAQHPVIQLDASPRSPTSELCFNCRLRPDFNDRGEPCRLMTGWALGQVDGGFRPTLRVVVVAGGRVLPAEIGYARITLLERIVRGKATCTSFAVVVPTAAIPPGERVRLFIVTGPESTDVVELPPPPER